MKIYHFNEQGRFVAQGIADESPLEPGVFMLPAMATGVKPPEVGAGYVAMWNGADWTIQLDDVPPPPAAPVEPTAAELRRAEILGRLSAIDAESVRPSREVATTLAAGLPVPPFALSKLSALEAEAGELRKELVKL